MLALHVWLDTYPEDFRDPPLHPTLHQLLFFTQHHLPGSELEAKVKHKLEKFTREDQLLGRFIFRIFNLYYYGQILTYFYFLPLQYNIFSL